MKKDIEEIQEQLQPDEEVLYGEELREKRETERYKFLVNAIFSELNTDVKNQFYKIYDADEEDLKLYIIDYMKKLSNAISIKAYSNRAVYDKFMKKYKNFLNNISVQKNRFIDRDLEQLEKKSKDILKFKDEYFLELSYEEFSDLIHKKLIRWRKNDCLMIQYPLLPYIRNKKSLNSIFNYDIGLPIYMLFKNNIIEDNIYRLPDSFIPFPVVSTNKTPRIDVVEDIINGKKTKVIQKRKEIQGSSNLVAYETIHLMDLFPDNAKEQLEGLIPDETYSRSDIILKQLDNKQKLIIKPYDQQDINIIGIILSKIDDNFYVTKRINLRLVDVLKELGLNPYEKKNKAALRNRLEKLRYKSVRLMEKSKGTETPFVSSFSFLDVIETAIVENSNAQTVTVTLSDKIYSDILKEDTINVYKDDFLSIKNSKYSNAIVLIYQFQLLRFSSHQRGKHSQSVASDFFIDTLNITYKNKKKRNDIIIEHLEQFVNTKVIIESYEYLPECDAWLLNFIKLTKTDLTMLLNKRKNYATLSSKTLPLIE